MKRFKFGWFPRAKYKDLVFYREADRGMNLKLFEMPDNDENRAMMEALAALSAPVASDARELAERIYAIRMSCTFTDGVEQIAWELRHYAAERERKAREEIAALRACIKTMDDNRMWPDEVHGVATTALSDARESAEPAEERMTDAEIHDIALDIARVFNPVGHYRAELDAVFNILLRRFVMPKPAEERGPEVGDVVYIRWLNGHHEVTTYSALLQAEIRGAAVIVLMRRAEVGARIGGKA